MASLSVSLQASTTAICSNKDHDKEKQTVQFHRDPHFPALASSRPEDKVQSPAAYLLFPQQPCSCLPVQPAPGVFPPRSLRSSDHSQLAKGPKTRLVSAGERAFAHAGPYLWNKLPVNICTAESLESFKLGGRGSYKYFKIEY